MDERVFVVERAETADGKKRARILTPVAGWISVKCIAAITDLMKDLLGAGKELITPAEEGEGLKTVTYSNYYEIDHDAMYKALWDSGLQYGPGFRLCKRAWCTDTEAIGQCGPVRGETDGWLIHPALADSMLHLCAVAPKPPPGPDGWPWMKADDK